MQQAGEEKGGVEAQDRVCREIAARDKLTITSWFQIDGVSGAAVKRSPQFQELLRVIGSGRCDGLVLREESRFLRPEHFGDLAVLETLEENKVPLYLPDGKLELHTPSGKLFAQMKFGFAGYERTIIRDRLMSGKQAIRSRGEWITGPRLLAYGLKLEKVNKRNRVVVDPLTINRVKMAFELFAEGTTNFTDLARKTGISYMRLRYILQNEIYTGWHVPWRKSDPNGAVYDDEGRRRYTRQITIPVEERQRICVMDRPPIRQELFDQVQRMLLAMGDKRGRKVNGEEDPFVYRGVARCLACGHRIISSRHSTQDYYVCSAVSGHNRWDDTTKKMVRPTGFVGCQTRRMRRDVFEALCDREMVAYLAQPDFVLRLVADQQSREQGSDAQAERERIGLEIQQTEAAIQRNLEAHYRGRTDVPTFEKIDDMLKRELQASQRALKRLEFKKPTITAEQWVPLAESFQRWGEWTPEQKRRLLRSIAPTLEVGCYEDGKVRQTRIQVRGFNVSLLSDDGLYVPLHREFQVREVRRPVAPAQLDGKTIYHVTGRGKDIENNRVML